jgi:transcription elongation factor Elf1
VTAGADRLPDDTVCACLNDTGERKVEIVERCLRCGALMYSDAYHDAVDERAALVCAGDVLATRLDETPLSPVRQVYKERRDAVREWRVVAHPNGEGHPE